MISAIKFNELNMYMQRSFKRTNNSDDMKKNYRECSKKYKPLRKKHKCPLKHFSPLKLNLQENRVLNLSIIYKYWHNKN